MNFLTKHLEDEVKSVLGYEESDKPVNPCDLIDSIEVMKQNESDTRLLTVAYEDIDKITESNLIMLGISPDRITTGYEVDAKKMLSGILNTITRLINSIVDFFNKVFAFFLTRLKNKNTTLYKIKKILDEADKKGNIVPEGNFSEPVRILIAKEAVALDWFEVEPSAKGMIKFYDKIERQLENSYTELEDKYKQLVSGTLNKSLIMFILRWTLEGSKNAIYDRTYSKFLKNFKTNDKIINVRLKKIDRVSIKLQIVTIPKDKLDEAINAAKNGDIKKTKQLLQSIKKHDYSVEITKELYEGLLKKITEPLDFVEVGEVVNTGIKKYSDVEKIVNKSNKLIKDVKVKVEKFVKSAEKDADEDMVAVASILSNYIIGDVRDDLNNVVKLSEYIIKPPFTNWLIESIKTWGNYYKKKLNERFKKY